jgi:hypothetical protein
MLIPFSLCPPQITHELATGGDKPPELWHGQQSFHFGYCIFMI